MVKAGRTLVGIALFLVLIVGVARPQSTPPDDVLRQAFQAGMAELEAEAPAAAARQFRRVVEAAAGYRLDGRGAAAYWLGEAYARQEEMEKARAAWRAGQRALTEAGAFDVLLADAYLRALFAEGLAEHRRDAVRVYKELLRHADSSLTEREAAVVQRHVAQAALLMTEDERQELISGALDDEQITLKEHVGTQLIEWWHRHDVAPATRENERLEEHLRRVAYARQHYAYPEWASGLDDRGHIYVQYGPPALNRSISYTDGNFIRDVFRFGVHVSASDFPDNEFWTYPHINRSVYYLFVDHHDHFELGETTDLLPSQLRSAFSRSERHLNRAVSALAAMQYIYRHLALWHISFGSLYDSVADYATWQEMQAPAVRAGASPGAGVQVQEVGAGVGQTRLVFSNPVFGIDTPNYFVQHTLAENRRQDHQATRIRRKEMPPQYSNLFEEAEVLPVAVRTARFLNRNGTTRTEVFWGTRLEALRLPEERTEDGSVVKLTAVRYGANYERQAAQREWYRVPDSERGEQGVVTPPAFTMPGESEAYHLGLQWEQYAADLSSEAPLRLGPQLRIAAHRTDTLVALSTEAGRLEMSDLKPMIPPTSSSAQDWSQQTAPYPFDRIAPDASLLLYFELYHLGFNADDHTQYAVEYDVLRRTDRKGLLGLIRGDDEQRTTTRTVYEGDSRTAREQILIDLSDWTDDGANQLQVTVRVTDETTGQQIERSIRFDIAPEKS